MLCYHYTDGGSSLLEIGRIRCKCFGHILEEGFPGDGVQHLQLLDMNRVITLVLNIAVLMLEAVETILSLTSESMDIGLYGCDRSAQKIANRFIPGKPIEIIHTENSEQRAVEREAR